MALAGQSVSLNMSQLGLGQQQPQRWYRAYHKEHQRHFYWKEGTQQTQWDEPPETDTIIENDTQQIVRQGRIVPQVQPHVQPVVQTQAHQATLENYFSPVATETATGSAYYQNGYTANSQGYSSRPAAQKSSYQQERYSRDRQDDKHYNRYSYGRYGGYQDSYRDTQQEEYEKQRREREKKRQEEVDRALAEKIQKEMEEDERRRLEDEPLPSESLAQLQTKAKVRTKSTQPTKEKGSRKEESHSVNDIQQKESQGAAHSSFRGEPQATPPSSQAGDEDLAKALQMGGVFVVQKKNAFGKKNKNKQQQTATSNSSSPGV